MNSFVIATAWMGLALTAALGSVQLGISVALVEIFLGFLAGNTFHLATTPWIDFLARDPRTRSCTSVCLSITDDWFQRLGEDAQRAAVKQLEALLDAEGVAYDIAGHRDAPPGLRIWTGATVERGDVEALLPWLDWAYGEIRRAAAA